MIPTFHGRLQAHKEVIKSSKRKCFEAHRKAGQASEGKSNHPDVSPAMPPQGVLPKLNCTLSLLFHAFCVASVLVQHHAGDRALVALHELDLRIHDLEEERGFGFGE